MSDRRLLYYITDRTQLPSIAGSRRRALLAKITEAAAAGVDYIQLRERDLSAKDLERLASDAVRVIREQQAAGNESRVPTRLLINARTDVALAAGADGVHLRSDDVAPDDVRAIWQSCGPGAACVPAPIIAVSCHSVADVLRAATDHADFAVFAPVFGKAAFSAAPPAGLDALREACRVDIPVLALGGVTLQNAAACLEAGAAGVAGIRLFQENKIEDTVRAVAGALNQP